MSVDTIGAAAQHFGVPRDAIIGKSRSRPLVTARYAISYIMRERDGLSLSVIGRRLGGRDHTTIHHQLEQARIALADDQYFAAFIAAQMALGRPGKSTPPPTACKAVKPACRPAPPPAAPSRPMMEKVHYLHYPLMIDGDGFGVDDHEWRGSLQRASEQLAVALRREHPERCAA